MVLATAVRAAIAACALAAAASGKVWPMTAVRRPAAALVRATAARTRKAASRRRPLADVARRSSPTAGRRAAAGPDACLFYAGANSLDELALYVGLKGFEFQVLEPPELIPVLRSLAGRLGRGAVSTG